MEKIRRFILGFLCGGSFVFIMVYLTKFGLVNPIYIDFEANAEIFISTIIAGIFVGWLIKDDE